MTSPCPVLTWYRLVRSGPCICLSSMYVQNLPAAHVFVVVSLHSLPSIFDYFLFSLFLFLFYGLPYLGAGPCLTVGFAFLQPTLFSYYHLLPYHSIIPTAKLFASILLGLFGPTVYSSPNGPVRPFFFYYITGGLLCPICFLLGVPDPFAFLRLPWPFS